MLERTRLEECLEPRRRGRRIRLPDERCCAGDVRRGCRRSRCHRTVGGERPVSLPSTPGSGPRCRAQVAMSIVGPRELKNSDRFALPAAGSNRHFQQASPRAQSGLLKWLRTEAQPRGQRTGRSEELLSRCSVRSRCRSPAKGRCRSCSRATRLAAEARLVDSSRRQRSPRCSSARGGGRSPSRRWPVVPLEEGADGQAGGQVERVSPSLGV